MKRQTPDQQVAAELKTGIETGMRGYHYKELEGLLAYVSGWMMRVYPETANVLYSAVQLVRQEKNNETKGC